MRTDAARRHGLRPEAALLLACARLRLGPEDKSRLRELAGQPLDWSHLLTAASLHGLLPLLYRHLMAACADLVPEAALEELRKRHHENAAWNLFLTSELLNLLSLFEAQGIAALSFKGPLLAAFAYGDVTLRQFVDLDLLIRTEDFPKARDLLVSQGFRPEYAFSPDQEKTLLRTYHNLNFWQESKGYWVEVHWEASKWFASSPLSSQGLWERAGWCSLAGIEVLTFSPEDLLIYLSLHGAAHCWERLAWILDVAALLELPQGLRWERVIALAEETKSERMFLVGLKLARYLTEVSPGAALEEIMRSDPAAEVLAGQVLRGLFDSSRRPQEFLFHLSLRQRWQDKVRFGLRSLFTPTDEDINLLSLPSPLFFLYSGLRPFRLTGKHLLKLKALRK